LVDGRQIVLELLKLPDLDVRKKLKLMSETEKTLDAMAGPRSTGLSSGVD